MFIQNFETQKEQSTFLFLAMELIDSDGKRDNREELVLKEIIQQSTLLLKPISSKCEYKNLKYIFSTKKKRISVLLELLGIALVDNEYHAEEEKMILSIAENFEISADQIEILKEWTKAQLNMQNLIIKFMES